MWRDALSHNPHLQSGLINHWVTLSSSSCARKIFCLLSFWNEILTADYFNSFQQKCSLFTTCLQRFPSVHPSNHRFIRQSARQSVYPSTGCTVSVNINPSFQFSSCGLELFQEITVSPLRKSPLAVYCLNVGLGLGFKSKLEDLQEMMLALKKGAGVCVIFIRYFNAQETRGDQTRLRWVLKFSQKYTLIYIHLLVLQWHF